MKRVVALMAPIIAVLVYFAFMAASSHKNVTCPAFGPLHAGKEGEMQAVGDQVYICARGITWTEAWK